MNDEHRHTRQRFHAAAAHYDRHAVVATEAASRLVERLDGLRFEPGAILDLGCGTGLQARTLHERFPRARVVAVDSARGMLERARRRRGRWRRRFEVLAADAESLPLADASIDLVFSSMVLEWCRDPERVLHELRRVMSPGGLLLMATIGPDTHRELHPLVAEGSRAMTGGNVIHAMRLGDLLIRTGFLEPVADSDWLTSTHPDLDSLLEDLRHTGTDLHDGIDADRMSAAFPATSGDGERYSLTWEIVYASAWAPEDGQPVRSDQGEIASIPATNIPVRKR